MTTSATSFPTFTLPHDPLTPLDPNVRPTPIAIRKLQVELYDNARAIQSPLGGGNYGHLGLLMSNADYIALAGAGNKYTFPERPDIPDYTGMNASARHEATETYKDDFRTFAEAQGFHNQLKKLLITAVPAIYINALAHDLHGFAAVPARTILNHLKDIYGQVTPEDLEANLTLFDTPWDPATPIETVFVNARRCRHFAEVGDDPISDAAYMRQLIKTFTKAGVFTQAIHEWNNKATADKTTANIVTHFTRADVERRLHDPTTKATLTANTAQKPSQPATNTVSDTVPLGGYCWSHGLGINPAHTSATCTKPAPGHNKLATLHNMMGGNNTIRRSPGEKPLYTPPPRRTANKAAVTVTKPE